MLVPRFRPLVAAACLTVFAPVDAHQDDAAESSLPIMDCDHPPKEAVSALPEPAGQCAQLDCRPSGQLLISENVFHVYRSKP
jgi:hypothetical protein